jgi:ribosomal protein L30E
MLKISLLASGTLMLNKHDLQRIENGAKKDLVRANNAPPEIEEVSVKKYTYLRMVIVHLGFVAK